MLGYGGHFLTKSRRYSVTFGQLRRARTEHRKAQRHPDGERDPWGRPLDETVVLVLADMDLRRHRLHAPHPGAELATRLRRHGTRRLAGPTMFHLNPNWTIKERSVMTRYDAITPPARSPRLLLTVPEAAAALAISRSKLYELFAAGLVRSVRIDGSRRVPVEALEAYVAVSARPGGQLMPRLRDGVIKRGGSWSYVIRVPDPATGVTKPRWVGGFTTEEDAKAARDEARVQARRGEYVNRTTLTVADYLAEWLETHAPA